MSVMKMVMLKFSDLFPNEIMLSPELYISGFDYSKTLYVSCVLSNLHSSGDISKLISFNIDELFERFHIYPSIESEILKTKILLLDRLIIQKETSLKLIELVLRNVNNLDGSIPIDGINILKAYLSFHEIAYQNYKESEKYAVSSGVDPILFVNFQLFNTSRFSHHNIHDIATPNIFKARLFVKFCANNDLLVSHVADFLKKKGCESLLEYWGIHMPLIDIITSKQNENITRIVIPDTHPQFEKIVNYLDDIITSEIVDVASKDFLVLRNRPLYKHKRGYYTVLSEEFLIEKIYKSFYFDFREINNKYIEIIPDFRWYYTTYFSEKYLLFQVLNKIFIENRYSGFVVKDGDELEENYGKGIIDYYVRKEKKSYYSRIKII